MSRSRSGERERRPEGEQLVESEPEGIDVGAGVPLAAESLGGHVPQGADDIAGARQPFFLGLGQAEVGDPDDTGCIQQQVGGLDVAVDDPPSVGVRQRPGRLAADLGHAADIVVPATRARLDVRDRRPARQHGRRCRPLTRRDRGRLARRRAREGDAPAEPPIGLARSRRRPARRGVRVRDGDHPGLARAGEPPGPQHPRDRAGRIGAIRRRRLAEPPQLVDDPVEALARDELHRIVEDLARLAHLEDRHDVGVMQPGRRPRLAMEPFHQRAVPCRLPRRTFSATRRRSDSCSAS